MCDNEEEMDRAMVAPKKDTVSSNTVGWKQMKQVASKAMKNGNITVDDVRNNLKELRSTYK